MSSPLPIVGGRSRWWLLLPPTLMFVGVIVVLWQLGREFGEAAKDLKSVKQEIISEMRNEREVRLNQVQTKIETEQKRQDTVTATIAAAADARASKAEAKAEVAKKKADKIEKRTKTVENILGVKPDVPILVPTPVPTRHPCGLLNMFRCE